MTDPLDPAWIAARLTPAQREALLWLSVDGGKRRMPPRRAVVLDKALRSLAWLEIEEHIMINLVEAYPATDAIGATTLGLRVREVVEREAGKQEARS